MPTMQPILCYFIGQIDVGWWSNLPHTHAQTEEESIRKTREHSRKLKENPPGRPSYPVRVLKMTSEVVWEENE